MKIYKVYIERENEAERTEYEKEVKFFSNIELAKEYFNILKESNSFKLIGNNSADWWNYTYFECKACGISNHTTFKIYERLRLKEIEVESDGNE